MPQTVERSAHRKEPRPLSMQEWGGGALATVAKSLSSRKYADIFLLGFFIFPFCSHISLVFLYFSRVCVRVCVWLVAGIFIDLLSSVAEWRRKFCNCFATLALASFSHGRCTQREAQWSLGFFGCFFFFGSFFN